MGGRRGGGREARRGIGGREARRGGGHHWEHLAQRGVDGRPDEVVTLGSRLAALRNEDPAGVQLGHAHLVKLHRTREGARGDQVRAW